LGSREKCGGKDYDPPQLDGMELDLKFGINMIMEIILR